MSYNLLTNNPPFSDGLFTQFGLVDNEVLHVSEFFADTIQGENFVGYPATFLRLQGCTLNCVFCDTVEVWTKGNPYTIDQLLLICEKERLVERFKAGQHLVITGGSPLRQQRRVVAFIRAFVFAFGFKPFIEIENEVILPVSKDLADLVDCWNNSPKLNNSGNTIKSKPEVVKATAMLPNSWFKFVVKSEEDWTEINETYILTGLIQKRYIVLMPMAATLAELIENREAVVNIAVRENVRYSSREHIAIWDRKTGV